MGGYGSGRWGSHVKKDTVEDCRVGKLSLPPGGKYYGCRHCYSLTYESAQTSNHLMERLMRYGGLKNLMRTVRSR